MSQRTTKRGRKLPKAVRPEEWVKLINKSDSIQKKEDDSQVLEAEIIGNELKQLPETELSLKEQESSPAYILGKVAGYLGSFVLGLLKSRRIADTDEIYNQRGIIDPGKGIRKRRRGKTRNG